MLIVTWAALALAGATAQVGSGNHPDRCIFEDDGAIIFDRNADGKAIAGRSITIDPQWTPFPSWFEPVPSKCFVKWKVTTPWLAKLSKDHKTLTVNADVPDGRIVEMRARIGNREVVQQWTVYTPTRSPIVATWGQRDEDCKGTIPLREVSIRDDGTIWVTWEPFESRHDYWGKWTVEGDKLILSDLTGSHIPADVLPSATFRIVDKTVTFDRPLFGTSGRAGQPCTAPFKRW